MNVKIISKSGKIPSYATEQSSGFDIRAYLPDGEFLLKAGERALIPTGIFLELDAGYEAQVRARSGLAIKYGIGLVNGVGTVDSDYRGELKIPLINWGNEDFLIKNNDRIAQVVIAKYEQVEFDLVDEINETSRGEGGFGHTGI